MRTVIEGVIAGVIIFLIYSVTIYVRDNVDDLKPVRSKIEQTIQRAMSK